MEFLARWPEQTTTRTTLRLLWCSNVGIPLASAPSKHTHQLTHTSRRQRIDTRVLAFVICCCFFRSSLFLGGNRFVGFVVCAAVAASNNFLCVFFAAGKILVWLESVFVLFLVRRNFCLVGCFCFSCYVLSESTFLFVCMWGKNAYMRRRRWRRNNDDIDNVTRPRYICCMFRRLDKTKCGKCFTAKRWYALAKEHVTATGLSLYQFQSVDSHTHTRPHTLLA